MRAPLYIVIPLCLLAAIATWLIGTHDKDFMTTPTPEKLADVSAKWLASQPKITPPADLTAKNDNGSENAQLISEALIKPPLLPTGDLATSPNLSEYGILGSEGSSALIQLAQHLETQSSPLRALLAWERVLDTTEPTVKERDQAARAIERLKTELPPWNSDPKANVQLLLHANASPESSTTIKNAITTMAVTINQTSGGVLNIDTKVSTEAISAPSSSPSLLLWFSTPENPAIKSASIFIPANLTKPEVLKRQIELGVYQILQANLTANTNFTPLPEPQESTQLMPNVTRLMWREFANSLK